jgi:hypothetical protein
MSPEVTPTEEQVDERTQDELVKAARVAAYKLYGGRDKCKEKGEQHINLGGLTILMKPVTWKTYGEHPVQTKCDICITSQKNVDIGDKKGQPFWVVISPDPVQGAHAMVKAQNGMKKIDAEKEPVSSGLTEAIRDVTQLLEAEVTKREAEKSAAVERRSAETERIRVANDEYQNRISQVLCSFGKDALEKHKSSKIPSLPHS